MKKYILFLCLAFVGCSKNNNVQEAPQDQLPPITTIGANTAGCIVNGEVLIPKNGEQQFGGPPAYGLTTGAGNNFHPPTIGNDYFYVRIANLRDSGGDDIYVHINNMSNGATTYNVQQSNNDYFDDAPSNPEIIVHTYEGANVGKTYLSGSNAGTITITRFDYPNGVYSGIFNAILYNKDNPSEKIQITDGRFDIKIATLNH